MKVNLLSGIFALFLFSSCASFTGFQTGRTSGKGNMDMTVSANYQGSGFESDDNDDDERVEIAVLEVHNQYGVGENSDVGLRLSTAGIISVDFKQQIVGGKDKKFALSAGAVVGSSFAVSLYTQVPLYLSYHPQENLAFYLNPRFTNYYTIEDEAKFYNSGSAGVLFGKNVKFGLDFSYSEVPLDFDLGSDASIFSVGLGAKIPLIKK